MNSGHSVFAPTGGCAEHYFTVMSDGDGDFPDQLSSLLGRYCAALEDRGLPLESGVWGTFYLSDAANCEHLLRAAPLFSRLRAVGMVLSVVQMPPSRGKIALCAYHAQFSNGFQRRELVVNGLDESYNGVCTQTPSYELFYFKNMVSAHGGDAGDQTRVVFDALFEQCKAQGLSQKNIIRTWIYVADIDNHYAAMSEARNAVFDANGLTAEGRFPASTGISGRTKQAENRVMVDALVIKGLAPQQIIPVDALSHLNRTREYSVRFERALMVVYGDRSHLFISGTASISPQGKILYEGNVLKQTQRVLDNIEALLAAANCGFDDLAYILVYLRDLSDYGRVDDFLAQHLPQTPRLIVHGYVCRPGWLVEVEGIAIAPRGDARFAPY